MVHLLTYAAYVDAVLALCGIGYYVLCLWSTRVFLRAVARRSPADAAFAPPVSILKPLRGTDPHMYDAFRSHCLQDYPEYELIFGVSEADDPAIALVDGLKAEFPDRRIVLVHCAQILGTNLKVSNLAQMLPHARYHHLLVNDSDIRVAPDYLRRILAPFAEESTGMVTTLYRGVAEPTLGSRLESIGIATDFSAGVLAALQVEHGLHFALGSTLAFTRRALEAIGGFEPLLDYLADDYELGNRIAAAGFKTVLSDVVVDTYLPAYSFADYWAHQLRWAHSVRGSRELGYLGVALTFGVPWALLALVLSRGARWSWALLAAALLTRFAMAFAAVTRVLHTRLHDAWLVPLRDVAALAVWFAGYGSRTVLWRGNRFLMQRGKLVRLQP
jgi:ceramide glucosyltransferase